MINKLLIANRGEIACRIIRTCRSLDITSIAVYSEADSRAQHVLMADESVEIGGARVKESYLNMDAVLQAAKDFGADAIHPGYGLLSENAEFAERVAAEGMLFIGPAPESIAKMGDKIQARKLMEAASVPVVPGRVLDGESEKELVLAARSIGFPVMLKAAAGGGGIGMQRVDDETQLVKAAASVRKKAETFFGSGDLFLEKYIIDPRHVEAQVFGDGNGNVRVLGTRDCSVQRRHQKVIEEAPAPALAAETIEALEESARRAAASIHYRNAGTVEFIVSAEEDVYFLEMNTRLQVEHPVTEETTGTDLVEWQLLLASGSALDELPVRFDAAAASVEARIYAEDPKTFFPSPGTITAWKFPEVEGIRYDMGFVEGDTISPFYDPMVGKVIARGESRQQAVNLLIDALEQAETAGIKTNIPMLIEVLKDPRFQRAEINTHFLMQTN
ncbi:acetyl/propionyl/methylcrotonyl-CoA carboxylase subunit alpha [Bacillus daqingensis]|uniref:biotin carboxylase n=1 Tax=Bacillus daqingensis TaxID=872396 RepID=A0ABV9NYD3_9BACI